jgi:hypothetical protein
MKSSMKIGRKEFLLVICAGGLTLSAQAQIEAVWLTCRSTTPEKTVVNWKSAQPGISRVFYGADAACRMEARSDDTGTLHHAEIATPQRGAKVFYRVETDAQKSETRVFQTCPEDGVRVAVVGDWGYANRPDLTALKADRPHILMTAGDNVASIVCPQRPGDKSNIQPFLGLIKSEADFFASTLFMPSLGNHDKQIGERGKKPTPGAAVYDVDAKAYLQMFALPDAGWKWAFTIPQANATFFSLDMEHVQDFGTSWQTCHDYRTGSEQFRWYDEQTSKATSGFVVTLLNERSTCRQMEKGAWHRMFSRGTLVITGFGYFAERAVETNAFPYYNTCVAKSGDVYRDPKSVVCEPAANYMLLTFDKSKGSMTVDLKRLDGSVIDRQTYPSKKTNGL